MAKLGLSSPWIEFYSEVEAMFKGDPHVRVIYDEENMTLKLYVDGEHKAEALTQILPTEKKFGKVTLKIEVIPANTGFHDTNISLYENAFVGNKAFSYVKKVEGLFVPNFTYVVFVNEVVQFFNDNLGDVNGNCSTLYEILAKDIFTAEPGVFFCTDVVRGDGLSFGRPLGEWP